MGFFIGMCCTALVALPLLSSVCLDGHSHAPSAGPGVRVPPPRAAHGPHAAIKIWNDTAFTDPANGILNPGAAGTLGDPYVIANWTIDAGGLSEALWIENTTKHFLVRNCTLQRSTGGTPGDPVVRLQNLTAGIVRNNSITSNFHALLARNCQNITIHAVNATTSDPSYNGLYLINCNGSLLQANSITNTRAGIAVEQCNYLTLLANVLKTNDYGVHLSSSHHLNLTSNYLYQNTNNPDLITGSADLWLQGNVFIDNWGLLLDSTLRATLRGNAFTYTWNYALNEEGVRFAGNLIEHWASHDIDESNQANGKPVVYRVNQTGLDVGTGAGQVLLVNCNDSVARDVDIFGVHHGVLVYQSTNTVVKNCSLTRAAGIYFVQTTACVATENYLKEAAPALHCSACQHTRVVANTFNLTNVGVQVQQGTYQEVSCNYFEGNSIAVQLQDTQNATLTCNNFSMVDNRAVSLETAHGSWVRGNNVSQASTGLYVSGTFNNITCNYLHDGYGDGMLLDGPGSTANFVAGNIIVNNSGDGIEASRAGGNFLQCNNLSGNTGNGIRVDNAQGNQIQCNVIEFNDLFGINCISGGSHYLAWNNVTGNVENGVVLNRANGCEVAYNVFIGNENPPVSDGGAGNSVHDNHEDGSGWTPVAGPCSCPCEVTCVCEFDALLSSNVSTTLRGQSISFSVTVSGGRAPFTYTWDFNDGTPGATGAAPTHQFMTTGTFTVIVGVRDDLGRVVILTKQVVVTNLVPAANFTANATVVETGTVVLFNDTSTGGDPPLTYWWTFGDGTNATTRNASHAWATEGTYPVTIAVTDVNGDVSQKVLNVTVTARASPPFQPPASCTDDLFEDNDLAANATSITLNFTRNATTGAYNHSGLVLADPDWFSLTLANTPCNLAVLLTATGPVPVNVTIFDANSRVLATWAGTNQSVTISATNLAGLRYHVLVNGTGCEPYALVVRPQCAPGGGPGDPRIPGFPASGILLSGLLAVILLIVRPRRWRQS